ncbi:dynein regulatory complex subunit 3 isoform X1 [Camelus dromedarius]|uniref:dynein regulatory complex subunit 3 isoform X1 n=1 Tax=Camelus dromedarius TaxID=9838 RepID=UPI00126350D3|nr:dynein regulatory complex subunit 3 isoform X3 [Camelus dromedarius]
MHQLCDMEPRVMDDDMLKLAVGEQGPRDEAGQLAKQEGILFKDVLSLQLDFQNILRIDNLWQFENLRKLQLDNNTIEKIEGLEKLTRLVWLDLSFNNIETIEGLDTLVNLEDLSLFNNRIAKIDSLDALVKLQVLSLGNNRIGNLMNIIYLRRFKDLRTLSLAGNPIAAAEDYRMFICAYLPDLVYLDFRRIDDHTKELAEVKHQYSTDELKHQENLMQARLEDEQARREELEEHKAAFVENLNGSFLFDSMYAEDVEGSKLASLPGVAELMETYKDKFVIICLNIFEYGLKQQEKRKAELDTFNERVQEAVQENQAQGRHRTAEFEEKHLLSLSTIRGESELTDIETKIADQREDIAELSNALMTLEMQLVEQLEVSGSPGTGATWRLICRNPRASCGLPGRSPAGNVVWLPGRAIASLLISLGFASNAFQSLISQVVLVQQERPKVLCRCSKTSGPSSGPQSGMKPRLPTLSTGAQDCCLKPRAASLAGGSSLQRGDDLTLPVLPRLGPEAAPHQWLLCQRHVSRITGQMLAPPGRLRLCRRLPQGAGRLRQQRLPVEQGELLFNIKIPQDAQPAILVLPAAKKLLHYF